MDHANILQQFVIVMGCTLVFWLSVSLLLYLLIGRR